MKNHDTVPIMNINVYQPINTIKMLKVEKNLLQKRILFFFLLKFHYLLFLFASFKYQGHMESNRLMTGHSSRPPHMSFKRHRDNMWFFYTLMWTVTPVATTLHLNAWV